MCKHLQGSLSANLKALKCEVQKGEFDHNNACRWEEMSDDMCSDCIKYLKSDVMGMKELYNKINKAVYDEYNVFLQ